jgi:hypothetical protein
MSNPSGKTGLWLVVEMALLVAMELFEVIKDHLIKKRKQ